MFCIFSKLFDPISGANMTVITSSRKSNISSTENIDLVTVFMDRRKFMLTTYYCNCSIKLLGCSKTRLAPFSFV